MAVNANSYGTASGVAAYVKRYTGTGGVFDSSSTPTLSQVETWINQISSQINVLLASNSFNIPITQTDSVLLITQFVESEVAELVKAMNNMGRLVNSRERRSSVRVIMDEVSQFIDENRVGFAQLGASQKTSGMREILTRSTDDNGNTIQPLFQRSQFGGMDTDK